MKKAIIFFLLVLIAAMPVSADDLWFYRSSYLILEPEITTNFDVVSKPNQKIDYVIANITFFPRQTRTQGILESYYSPTPKISDDALTFEWKSPAPGSIQIRIKNKLKIINSPMRVTKKVGFPLKEGDIPPEYSIYTKPSEIIDSNNKITRIASEIATGKDDLFKVVDGLAVWVNENIKYNLSTVTVEAAQKSSWVLENREGVCDELTSLFISMLRSLGIPARFVAGISYTNLDIFENKWGAHGWAEVYFPGYGWVPYDVTYGEYGWVDPSHIQAKVAEDAGKFTSRYTWRAENGVSLNIGSLNTNVNLIEQGEEKNPDVSIDLDTLKGEVSFGSYNLVTANAKNLANYYQSLDVFLSYTTRISYIGQNKKHIVLEPNGEKSIYWIIKTDDGLDKDYIYTFPIVVYTLENATAKTTFTSVIDARKYSLDEINRTLMQMGVEDTMVYSRNVKLNCSSEKREYYDDEKPAIDCIIKNTGNVFLTDLKICMEDECQTKNVGITEEKSVNFTVHKKEIGKNEAKITVKSKDVSKISYVEFGVLDKPEVDFDDIEYPFNVSYDGEYTFKFTLKKKSFSSPYNIDLKVKVNRKTRGFHFENVTSDKRMEIIFRGKDLRAGQNEVNVTADYEDKNKARYSLDRDFEINLVNVTLFQKVMIFLRMIF